LTFGTHCAAAIFGPRYWFDEVYMLAIGRFHLDWGSADQPPLTPLLAAAMDAIAPDSTLALRLPAALATAGAVVVAALIARELGGERRAQVITAVAQATGLWLAFAGHWLTPYALEPVQWLTVVWLLIRWMRVRDDRLLVTTGVLVGLAALTKFQVLLLCVVLILTALVLGPRELVRRPAFWVGTGIAVALAAPTLWWQHRHGWPQLQMSRVVAGEADALYGGRPEIAIQLVVMSGVLGTGLLVYGTARMFRDEALRPYRFVAATFVVLLVVFVATAGRPYYLCGLYGPLVAAGAVGLQRRATGRPRARRWLLGVAVTASILVAAGTLVQSAVTTRSDVGEQIARETAVAYTALPENARAHTALLGGSYIVAAYLDGYATQFGLPKAFSLSRSYGYFPPPEQDRDAALYVAGDDSRLLPYFSASRVVGAVGEDLRVFLLEGRTQPWPEIWHKLRTLTVE
jgi:4-amino-4-deoxy-L-arabinose transferase-like glycosyltransferase